MIPVAPRAPDAIVPVGGVAFSCTLCGDCCRDLRHRKGAPDWPESFARLARVGYYALPTEGGLQAWAWERRRMLREAEAKGLPLRFVPSLVVADELSGRLVTLVYQLDYDDCPFLGPGQMPDTLVCGAYEARPLVCRAFPVVVTGGNILPSSKCPVIVEPAEATRDEFERLFGDAFLAAENGSRLTREVARALRTLEDAGVLRLARDLSKEQVLMRLARAPPLDAWDLLVGCAGFDERAMLERMNPDARYVFTPMP